MAQHPAELGEARAVDHDPGPLHVHQHRNQRHLQRLEQTAQFPLPEHRGEVPPQLDPHRPCGARTRRHDSLRFHRSGAGQVEIDKGQMRAKLPGSTQRIELKTSNGGIEIR